ncbi:MAG: riboflavin synthase [Actinomycetota bacterium]
MFTGIVEERGRVRSAGRRLEIEAASVSTDASLGDSISVNGVCLTVAERHNGTLSFDLAEETIDRSTLGALSAGDPVNLERPVTPVTRLGGHLVQGHVDAVATVVTSEPAEGGEIMTISIPAELRPYIVEKGSIAVDGVSLTVASVDGGSFNVALIPHTLGATTLGTVEVGDGVNLEVDVIAKYVESLLGRRP